MRYLIVALLCLSLAGCGEIAYSREDADRLGRDAYREIYTDALGQLSFKDIMIDKDTGCEYYLGNNSVTWRTDVYGNPVCKPIKGRK